MDDAITPQSRVAHIADRNRDVPRLGTVGFLWNSNGTDYARVKWDSEITPTSHPVANLVLANASP